MIEGDRMTGGTQLWDPFDKAFIEDPFPTYAMLREERPVYHNEERGFYALTRWDDVVEANRDWATYSSAEGVDLDRTGSIFFGEGNIVEQDPPSHDIFRLVLTDFINPGFVRLQEEDVTRRVQELTDRLDGRSNVDFAGEYAMRLPLGVVCDLLGIDGSDHEWVFGRFVTMFERESGSTEIPQVALSAAAEVRDYLENELKSRRRGKGTGDLLSAIANGTVGDRPLTHLEQVGMSTLVISAGITTTKNLLTNIFWYMARNPELRSTVEERAARYAQPMIEEFLRFDSPIQNSSRTAMTDVELHGVTIPQGSTVTLVYGSANRDPERFDDADQLNVTRRVGKHMAFGGGVHLCIGAPLARLEAKIVLQHGLPQMKQFAMGGEPERVLKMNERGFESLPLVFDK
ncbi:cytochrome P450 [Microbacterium sp. YY-01]